MMVMVLMMVVIMVLGFGAPNPVMGLNQYDINQKIADEKEEARFEQYSMDFYNKSLEYKTACPDGGNYTIEDFRSSIYGVDKTCVDPDQEIRGAIIFFK
jgi:hypothetical protein